MKPFISSLGAAVTFGLSLTVTAASPFTGFAAARVTCHGRVATIVGTEGDDELDGTRKADVIVGLRGNDQIRDRGGNDIVCGGPGNDWIGGWMGYPGNDKIDGGAGNDRLNGGLGHNLIGGGPGDDNLGSNWWKWGVNKDWGGRGNDEIALVSPNEDAYGGPGNDTIVARAKPGSRYVLSAGSGHDTLILSVRKRTSDQQWDLVRIDLNRGRINADGIVSRILGRFTSLYLQPGGANSFIVIDTPEDDRLISYGARNVIERGLEGNDALYSKGGDDTLNGGPGTDQGHAGLGQDTCVSIEGPFVGSPAVGDEPIGCETSTP